MIRAILFPLRLLGSFLMAMARIYVCLIIGTVAVVLLSDILAPVGHVLAPIGSIIDLPFAWLRSLSWETRDSLLQLGWLCMVAIVAAWLIDDWLPSYPPTSSSAHASDSALADQVPALPAAPGPAHALGAREVYRGSLTTLPPA